MPPATLTLSSGVRRGLHAIGSALALVAVVFVGTRLHAYWLKIDVPYVTPAGWSAVLLLALTYGAANLFLASAWWQLLQQLGVGPPRLCAIRLYGLANLAKYVPGNIFHLAGRQAMGMAAGIAGRPLAKSMAWELGLIALGGSLFGWILLPRWMPVLPAQAGSLLMLLTAGVIAVVLGKWVGRHALLAFLWQLLFLLVSGVIFVALIALFSQGRGVEAQYWLPVGGAYITAWLLGLVTPGAPAGVGVREAILLFLLQQIISEDSLLIAILFGRLVTVVGDLAFFAAAACISPTRCAMSRNYV